MKAAFLLEAASEAFLMLPLPLVPVDHLRAIEGILEDACTLARARERSDPLRVHWFEAALSVLQGPGASPAALSREIPHLDEQLGSARVALARARPFEFAVWSGKYLTAPSGGAGAPPDRQAGDDLVEAQLRRRLGTAANDAEKALERAAAFSEVRAEARLRLGVVKALAGEPAEAVAHLDEASRLSADEWLSYVGHLIKGQALNTLGQHDAAKASLESALHLRPHTRSANLALSAFLFSRGTPPGPFLDQALAADADPADPWAQYLFGDYRFWPAARDQLRKTLR